MKRWLILIILFAIGLAGMFSADVYYRSQIRQENERSLTQAVVDIQNRLQASVNTRLLAVADLQAFMLAGPTLPSSEIFDHYAAAALENYPEIRAFQYVDPDRIIRYIYPLAGNEAALGLDISTQWSAPFIEKAIAERRTTVSDPTETIQGSFSIIARAPLFREDELVGVVQVVFDVSSIGEEALAGTDDRFDVRLSDAQNEFFWGTETIINQSQIITLPVSDNQWRLTVGWAESEPAPSPFILAMIWVGGGALLFSLLFILIRIMAESDNRFRQLALRNQQILETALEGYILADGRGEIVEVNPAYCQLVGYTRDELRQMNINNLEAKLEPAKVEARIQEMMAAGALRFETRHRHKDGRILDLEVSTAIMDDPVGPLVAAFVRDVTEQNMAKTALQENRALLNAVIEGTTDAVFAKDVDGRYLLVNTAVANMFGKPAANIIGQDDTFIFPANDVPAIQAVDRQVVESQHAITYEEIVPLADGEARTFLSTKGPLFDGAGKVAGLFGISRDITDLKQAETVVRASEKNYRTLFEEASDAILVLDGQNKVLDANKRASELLGIAHDELLASNALQFMHKEDVASKDHTVALAQLMDGKTIHTDYRLRRVDGSYVQTELSTKMLDENRFLNIIRDLTERITAEKALAEALAKWESLVQNAPNYIAILDQDYCLQYVNHFQPGTQLEDVIGTSTFDYTLPEYHDMVREKIDHVFQTGEAVRYELQGQASSGETAWYETWVGPLVMNGAIAFVTLISSEITERKLADVALKQYTRRLETLRRIDRAILSAQSKEEIAQAALIHVHQLISCQRAIVAEVDLFSRSVKILASNHSEGIEVESSGQNLVLTEEFITQISQGRPIVIDDLAQYSDYGEVAALYASGIRTYLFIPLTVQDELTGVLTFGANKPGAFSKADVTNVQQVADHLAVALKQARLYALIQNRLQELITLQQASLAFAYLLSPAEIGREVIRVIETELQYKRGAIFLLTESGTSLELLAHSKVGFEGHAVQSEWDRVRSLVADGQGISGWVARSGETVRLGNVKMDPRYVEADPNINSELCVPLKVGGKTIGALNVESEALNAFSDHDERLLMTLASQMAVALQNAWLYDAEKEQRVLAEALRDTAVALNKARSLDEVLDALMANIGQVIAHDARDIMLVQNGTAYTVRVGGSVDVNYEAWQRAVVLPIETTPDLMKMIDSRSSLNIPDTHKDDSWVPIAETEWIRSCITAPIFVENTAVGFISIYCREPHRFSRNDARRLEGFADQAAIGIEKTELIANLEQRVQDRTTELVARNQELETFTYSVSHDLKAPLRGIDGYSRLLLEGYTDQLDDDGRFFLQTVRKATAQMNELIDDLLLYSRLERREMKTGPVFPQALIKIIVAERAEEVAERGVAVNVDLPETAVAADPDGLTMALRNLLDNALKFTRGVPQPVIEIGGQETQTSCIMWVRDNGMGFDMKFHDRIFEIFQRLHRAEEYPGTGVGLAIVHKAVQRMNGRVWAESQPGEGAAFYLEIPRSL